MTTHNYPCHDPHRVDAVLASALDRLAKLHVARAYGDLSPLAEALEFAMAKSRAVTEPDGYTIARMDNGGHVWTCGDRSASSNHWTAADAIADAHRDSREHTPIGEAFSALLDVLSRHDNDDHSASLLDAPDVVIAVKCMADAIATAGDRYGGATYIADTTSADRAAVTATQGSGFRPGAPMNSNPELAADKASIVDFFGSVGVTCEVLVDAGPNGGTLRPRIGKPSVEQMYMLKARESGLVNFWPPQPSVVARTEGPRKLVVTYPDGRSFALRYGVVGEDD